ncbi:MAG: barstar family protein [Actinobacteria bacterium]|jgi:RNAse (barnase) inhibitor barstar|nr:barstar family protein [Actinomycetota bacterium]
MIRTLGPQVDLDGLVADALEEGREVHLVRAAASKQATLEAFAEALSFPGWFGHNLDALADCLDHLLATATAPWELILDEAAVLRRADDRAYDGIRAVLADLALRHPSSNLTVIDR